MVQGHERGHAPVDNGLEDRPVVLNDGVVELASSGEDSGPLNGEAERVEVNGLGPVEVGLEVGPERHRITRGLDSSFVLPGRPVVGWFSGAGVATFNLEAGGRYAEGEGGREDGRRHGSISP